jgi:hypothetical protein
MPFVSRSSVCALCENQAGKCGQEKCPVYKAPAIDAYPVTRAHWIYKPFEGEGDLWLYHCSACANLSARPRAYCAECGAKMEMEMEMEMSVEK